MGGEPWTDRGGRIEAGFLTGYGWGSIAEGAYGPLLFIFHLGYNLKVSPRKEGSGSGICSFFTEPQYNLVFSSPRDYEFGMGFGVQYLYPLRDRLRPYLLAETGPRYISIHTADQVNGFIFSSAAGAGPLPFPGKRRGPEPGIPHPAHVQCRHASTQHRDQRSLRDGRHIALFLMGLKTTRGIGTTLIPVDLEMLKWQGTTCCQSFSDRPVRCPFSPVHPWRV